MKTITVDLNKISVTIYCDHGKESVRGEDILLSDIIKGDRYRICECEYEPDDSDEHPIGTFLDLTNHPEVPPEIKYKEHVRVDDENITLNWKCPKCGETEISDVQLSFDRVRQCYTCKTHMTPINATVEMS